MMPWFIWKGKNSLADFGLWVGKFPNRIRPEEQHEEVKIPGRAGSLIMLEGEDVYTSYNTEMTLVARNELNMGEISDWLRGSGELVLSIDINKVVKVTIIRQLTFARDGNCLTNITVPLLCQPFRMSRYPEHDTFSLPSATGMQVFNPGDVASKPVVVINGHNSTNTIVVGGKTMTFSHQNGELMIDCEAQLITRKVEAYDSSVYYYKGDYAIFDSVTLKRFTDSGSGATLVSGGKVEEVPWDGNVFRYIWLGSYTGEFFSIPANASSVFSQTGDGTMTIRPEWRWF